MGCINYGLLWYMYTFMIATEASEVTLHLGATGLVFHCERFGGSD